MQSQVDAGTGEDWQLTTLLESAKHDEFHRLCGELVWFFEAIKSPQAGKTGTGRQDVPWSLHSPQVHVQCTASSAVHLACQISQTAGSTGQPALLGDASGKVKLDLCSVVPLPPSQQPNQSRLVCGVDNDMFETLLDGHRLEQLCCDLVPESDMHTHAQLALQTTPRWNGQDAFSKVALFTDGSFKEGHDAIAYAVVVLLQVCDQWHFAGFVSGAVDSSQPSVDFQANAHVAELCGMIHARLIHLAIGADVQLEICYDCISACQVMCLGSHKACPVARVAASVDAICFLQGIQSAWTHVAGHSGHPWNEVVDFVARQRLKEAISGVPIPEDLVQSMLGEGYMNWLWMALAAKASPACWPAAHVDGSFSSAVKSRHESSCNQTASTPVLPCQHAFHICAVTYNTLSLRVAGQSECLEQHFGQTGCCVLGLQECRQSNDKVEHGSHFFKFASPAVAGQGGCQIWLSKFVHPGVDSSGHAVKWRPESFVKHHSDYRCLAISGMAGSVRFGIIAAHAHTATTSKDEIRKFWRAMSDITGRLPETSIKIILIDANASYDSHCWERIYYKPLDANSQEMVSFLEHTSMAPSDLWDDKGNAVKTWRSPNGYEKAIDYVLVPRDMSMHLRTVGVDLDLLDLYAGIDHRPLTVVFSFAVKARAPGQDRKQFDTRAMCSAEGQQKLRDIFYGAPVVPWETHACDHWEQLQAYLTKQCVEAFPCQAKGPRKTYINDQLWDMIVHQRHIRGQLRCRNQLHRKDVLCVCFGAWAILVNVRPHWNSDFGRFRSQCQRRCCEHDRWVAILWHRLTSLRRDINKAMKQCQAERAQAVFREARDEGPGAVSRLMTALMKSGRRYKPPSTLPPIKDARGHLLTEEADVFRELGQHFAKAERAVEVEQQKFRRFMRSDSSFATTPLDGNATPAMAELSASLRRAKGGKAPGASGLKPEIFKSASTPAAVVLYPILLKQFMRGEIPLAFLRSQICAIPKPSKCPNSVEGWRSIALQELPHKAICATMRRFLLAALDSTALPLQLGGRPGGSMLVPSLHVVAHLRRMRQLKQSAGVLYIDGAQAFYSTIREIVTGADETVEGAARIVSIIEDMRADETVREDIFRSLCGPSILEQAGTPTFVQDFLRVGFRGSHFCVGNGNDRVYVTHAGTIPGSPLADVVFQLALVRFHHNLQCRLRAQDLLVTVRSPSHTETHACNSTHEASTSTWVDDLAVVVCSDSAAGLIPKMAKVAAVVEQCLSSTGVSVNYSPGKTAAMYCFRGRGARDIRKFWTIEQQSCVQLPAGPGRGKHLQLVTEYTHLGSRLQANGQQVEAIAYRLSIAKPVFAALRKRLLFNGCLTCAERVRLMVQGPLASLLHGSGLWVTSDPVTARRAHEAIAGIYRQCVRPILGVSSRGLTNAEVCYALAVLEPADVLRFQRMRAVISIASLTDEYLIEVLAQERFWIGLVISDWAHFQELECPVAVSCETLDHMQVKLFFEWIRCHARRLQTRIKVFIQNALHRLQERSDLVLRKAQLLDGVFGHGAISWRQPLTRAGTLPCVACPECHKVVQGAAALAAHRSKTHGVVSIGALLHDHTSCPVCLVEYWSPPRLWEHLRKAHQCRQVFEASDPTLLPTCKNVGKNCKLPATRIHGPREWWATLQPHVTTDSATDASHDLHTRVVFAWTRPAQDELARLLRACEGCCVNFRGNLLVTLNDHHWVVPSRARASLERLVDSSLQGEFVSLQML